MPASGRGGGGGLLPLSSTVSSSTRRRQYPRADNGKLTHPLLHNHHQYDAPQEDRGHNESNTSGVGTRSCLTGPFLGIGGQPRHSGRAKNGQQQQQRRPLVANGSPTTTATTGLSDSRGGGGGWANNGSTAAAWESFQGSDPFLGGSSRTSIGNNTKQQPSRAMSVVASSSPSLESLLTPPTPMDRSPANQHRSGVAQQRAGTLVRRGLYDGETEPEGVRGQEAVVVSPTINQPPPLTEGGGGALLFPTTSATSSSGRKPPLAPTATITTTGIATATRSSYPGSHSPVLRDFHSTNAHKKGGGPTAKQPAAVVGAGTSGGIQILSPATASTATSTTAGSSNGHHHDHQLLNNNNYLGTSGTHLYGYPQHLRLASSDDDESSNDDNHDNNHRSTPLNHVKSSHLQPPSVAAQETAPRMQPSGVGTGKSHQWKQHQRPPPPRKPDEGGRNPSLLRYRESQDWVNKNNNSNTRSVLASDRVYSDAESTTSDDDIQYMLPDLLPSLSAHDLNPDVRVPSGMRRAPFTGPSPAAQKAAAAAAAAASTTTTNETDTADRGVGQQQQRTATHNNNDNNTNGDMDDDAVANINSMALDHIQIGEYEMALEAFARVLAIQRRRFGEIHPAVASAYHNLGTVHAKRASLLYEDSVQQRHFRAQALECFQAAARAARDSLGRNHPNVALSLVRIGFLLLQSRQYQNAVITFHEALRIRSAHFGPRHGLVANLYNNLGVCHMHLGHFEEGLNCLNSALSIQTTFLDDPAAGGGEGGDSNPTERATHLLELADTLFNVGGLCLEWIRRQGPDVRRATDAEEAFSEALRIRLQILGPKDPMALQLKELLEMAKAIPRPRVNTSQPLSNQLNHQQVGIAMITPTNGSRGEPAHGLRDYHPVTATQQRPAPTGRTVSHPSPRGSQGVSDDIIRQVYGPEPAVVVSPDPSPREDARGRGSEHVVWNHPSATKGAAIGSIFRSAPPQPTVPQSNVGGGGAVRGGKIRHHRPPVVEVSVSKDEGTDEEGNVSPGTRIFVSSHHVPETTPPRRLQSQGTANKDVSDDAVATSRSVEEHFTPDSSSEPPAMKTFSYDAEENCLISDTGVDSEHGRVHYPPFWNRGAEGESEKLSEPRGRDIMVTRPYRSSRPASRTTPSSQPILQTASVNSEISEATTTFSTGNKVRDELMTRARALLDSHPTPETPPDTLNVNSAVTTLEGHDPGPINENTDNLKVSTTLDPDWREDGVAPLGGDWATSLPRKTLRGMLEDPMNYLPEIHDEATKKLKESNFVDAAYLFGVVLDCQRRRHGPLHPDVAAALHNLGITQLRGQNHFEALKSFEEAARVRKGSLGQDHPLVAVSLVKVGITLLLLHRFDEALWSFREALSVRKRALGPLHPSAARVYNNIGCVHVEFNEFKEARRAFEAALDIQRNALCLDPDSGPLMFGTATTLCNLGYLYRYRDMHAKAALVLKEAVDLQENVLGRSHATVLSTLDNLADSYASSGHAVEALRTYNMILERFRAGGRSGSQKMLRAEAVLLYKMSRVHSQRNDRGAQLDNLKLALRSIRTYNDAKGGDGKPDGLERRIQFDIRACREQLEKEELKWV